MRHCIVAATVIAALLSGVFFSHASAQTIVRFSEDPWPPFTYGDDGAPPTGGIAPALVKALAERVGFGTDLMLYPWKRCLRQMQTGERDAIMLCGYCADREQYMVYTDSLMNVRDLIFFKTGMAPDSWETVEDLRHLVFVRTVGFQYGDAFERAVTELGIKVDISRSDIHSFRMLADGRVNAFICNEMTAKEIFRTHPELEKQVEPSPKPFKSGPLFMAFSRKSPAKALIPAINEAIKAMKNDGTIARIIQAN